MLHLEAVSDPADSFPPAAYQPRRGDITLPATAGAPSEPPANGEPQNSWLQHGLQAPLQQQQQQYSGSQLGSLQEQQQQQQAPVMFVDSIESLMRNVVQKQKIDMANEVIDAGRFDNETTDEQRRRTLEEMLLVSCCWRRDLLSGTALHTFGGRH